MTATVDLIQKLYIGYFGRAGDPEGLQYWVNRYGQGMTDAQIAQSFSVQNEAKAMYGYLAAPSLGMGQDAFLEAVYQNLFERSIEPDGLTYWKGQLANGRPVGGIILDIINGAVGNDATTVTNKLAVANYYTEAVIDANATWTLADDQQDAIDVLAGVTSATSTVTTGQALADSLVAADTAPAAQTYTLSTGMDAVPGTAGNDTINANPGASNANTFTALDSIDGGAGTDTFNISEIGAAGGAAYTLNTAGTVKNVEVLNYTVASDNVGDAVTADLSGWSGLTTANVVISGTDAPLTLMTTKGNVTTASIDGATTSAITDSATKDTLATVSVLNSTGLATLTSDALTTVNLTASSGGATVLAAPGTRALAVNLNGVTAGTVTDATATSLAVTSSGTKTTATTLTAAAATAVTLNAAVDTTITDMNVAAAKTITVSGAGATTISALTTVTALTAIDASGSTGGLTVTPAIGTGVAFTGGEAKDSISLAASHAKAVAMGGGDDTVTMAGAVTTGGSVDAGAGTDTLSMTSTVAAAVSVNATFEAGISNFEKVQIGQVAAGATDTINMANLDDINYLISAGTAQSEPGQFEIQEIAFGTLVNSQAYTLTVDGVSYITAASSNSTTAVELVALLQAATVVAPFTVLPTLSGVAISWTQRGEITPSSTLSAGGGYTTATATEYLAGEDPLAAGILAVTNMASGGTLELTGVINGASSVAVTNANTGTADVLNIKLNGTANIVNAAALMVADVETINIEATDSSADTTTLTNPAAASKVYLAAAAAKTITVTGNHGVDFTGSTLTNVTTLDASGVVSVGNAAGATAAQIATTGAVTFSSVVANKAVTVTTGNGADSINVSSVNDATFLATGATASTVTTGAGDDTITGSAGKDVIDAGAGNDSINGGAGADTLTGGTGNDIFVMTNAEGVGTDSTLSALDVITDFSANTYGNGTSGAAGTGAAADATKWTGDVLKFDVAAAITKVDVSVQSSAADAQIFIQTISNSTTDTVSAALDSSTGRLYVDLDSNGVIDSVIQLTGVTTITEAAFQLV